MASPDGEPCGPQDPVRPVAPISRQAFQAGAVPVVSVGVVMGTDTELLPAVMLDTTNRPDVADLARVHDLDGIGDLRCGFGACDLGDPGDWLVRFDVAVDHPVMCRFHAVISWSANTDWLDGVAAHGAVAFGTEVPEVAAGSPGHQGEPHDGVGTEPSEVPEAVQAGPAWLVVNVEPQRLAPVLNQLRLQARDRE